MRRADLRVRHHRRDQLRQGSVQHTARQRPFDGGPVDRVVPPGAFYRPRRKPPFAERLAGRIQHFGVACPLRVQGLRQFGERDGEARPGIPVKHQQRTAHAARPVVPAVAEHDGQVAGNADGRRQPHIAEEHAQPIRRQCRRPLASDAVQHVLRLDGERQQDQEDDPEVGHLAAKDVPPDRQRSLRLPRQPVKGLPKAVVALRHPQHAQVARRDAQAFGQADAHRPALLARRRRATRNPRDFLGYLHLARQRLARAQRRNPRSELSAHRAVEKHALHAIQPQRRVVPAVQPFQCCHRRTLR